MISKNTIKYIHSLELKKNRMSECAFVAEGPKVVADLMEVMQPRMIVATEQWYNTTGRTPQGNDYMVSVDELRHVSFLQHPQDVLAVFPIPNHSTPNTQHTTFNTLPSTELCLALDAVQDPGNLGTIIRVADWFGVKTIFCGTGTVDAYSPKTVQSTMGSIARVKLVPVDLPTFIDSLPTGVPVYGTALDGDDIYTAQLSHNGLIIMGNEGNGISSTVMSRLSRRLLIPRYATDNHIDSLNVAIATAITCAEFRRRMT